MLPLNVPPLGLHRDYWSQVRVPCLLNLSFRFVSPGSLGEDGVLRLADLGLLSNLGALVHALFLLHLSLRFVDSGHLRHGVHPATVVSPH